MVQAEVSLLMSYGPVASTHWVSFKCSPLQWFLCISTQQVFLAHFNCVVFRYGIYCTSYFWSFHHFNWSSGTTTSYFFVSYLMLTKHSVLFSSGLTNVDWPHVGEHHEIDVVVDSCWGDDQGKNQVSPFSKPQWNFARSFVIWRAGK